MRFILLISFLSFVGCATHTPVSEMVMFNKKRSISSVSDSSMHSGFAWSGSFQREAPPVEAFRQKRDADYMERNPEVGQFSLGFTWLEEDNFAFNFNAGGATGMDFTAKLTSNTFTTFGFSMNGSASLIYQYRLVNEDRYGATLGVFGGRENRLYYSDCTDCIKFGPSGSIKLYSFGGRVRFLIKDRYYKSPGFSGSLRIGFLPEVREPFVGVSFSFLSF